MFDGCQLAVLLDTEILIDILMVVFAAQDNEAYKKLRIERTNAKLMGKRAKRAADAAAEEKDKAK